MKYSNKYIPAVCFTLLLAIIGLYILLFMTYKNGNANLNHSENTVPSSVQSFPEIFVCIRFISGAT